MRGMILLGVIMVLAGSLATPARGQAGRINLFVDSSYSRCWHYEEYGTYDVHVYVVHQNTPGATGCRFKLKPSGSEFGWTYISETSSYAVTGNTRTGITASYGACLASNILIATVLYLKDAGSGHCTTLTAVADPAAASGTIEVYDCNGNVLVGSAQPLLVNPNDRCPVWCQLVPIEETTWGRVKALYE